MKLYTYWRSSAVYRVRIGLNLKQVPFKNEYINLVKEGGEQHSERYRQINRNGLIPSLELDSGDVLTQSLAILEYLDETYPHPSFLSKDPIQRAHIRAFAQSIACDVHPINNLRILRYLSDQLNISDPQRQTWYANWVNVNFTAIEQQLSRTSDGKFCFGTTPTQADICLIPQIYNAYRFNIDMKMYPTLVKINQHCLSLDAFKAAIPDAQEDAY